MLPKNNLTESLTRELSRLQIRYMLLDPASPDSLNQVYGHEFGVNAFVLTDHHPGLPQTCWLDCISNLCKRNPVLIISEHEPTLVTASGHQSELIPWIRNPGTDEIIAALDAAGCLGFRQKLTVRNIIPFYNHMLSHHILQQRGSLSLLCIQADTFRRIAMEYGAEAYGQLQACFQQILVDLWGAAGSFRKNDILCRKSAHNNTYFILLEQSRSQQSIPPPGALEKLADRIVTKIQAKFWAELFKTQSERILPLCLNSIPDLSIGYATAISNPCIASEEIIEKLISDSEQMARVQMRRITGRQREHIQSMIRGKGILIPHFQAIFEAGKITTEEINSRIRENSVKPLVQAIYGFEALIRTNERLVEQILSSDGPIYMEPRFLKPDILFSIAADINLALELDQGCLKVASQHFKGLPGKLFANILPRNFYYVERLQKSLPSELGLVFEVSEAEAINNFDLILKSKKEIIRKNFGIAIDDFGKGYAGLDRILKIKPDVVKLDRCLVQNIHLEPPKKAFVRGVIDAARCTKSRVLAEGIETIEELRCLQELGVDLVQGFLLHRPQSLAQIRNEMDLNDQELEPVA